MFNCEVATPKTLAALTELLADPESWLIAGGTDLLPRLRRAQTDAPVKLIDMSRLAELRFIRERDGRIEIGALTSHAVMASSTLLLDFAPALAQACTGIGAPQTRSRGTLGGNLVNASPAADTAPALLCLDADVTLVSNTWQRTVPLVEFFIAPGKTCLGRGEFLHSVGFDLPRGKWGAASLKLGRRSGMAIAVVSVSVFMVLDDEGRIQLARVALGSVDAVPVRSPHVEALLLGQKPTEELFNRAAQAVQLDIHPIDDLRATADYRRYAAQVLVARALASACSQAEGRCA